jgi:DNA-binding MarR family transcriptional regulator
MTKPAAQDLGGLLQASSSRMSTLGDRVLGALGVTTPQWKVLVVLARNGPSRLTQLVEALSHDQAALSRLVVRMEKSGLVERADDPADARAQIVRLTRKGTRAYQRCDVELRPIIGELSAALGPAGDEHLKVLLNRLIEAIGEALSRRPPRRAP